MEVKLKRINEILERQMEINPILPTPMPSFVIFFFQNLCPLKGGYVNFFKKIGNKSLNFSKRKNKKNTKVKKE